MSCRQDRRVDNIPVLVLHPFDDVTSSSLDQVLEMVKLEEHILHYIRYERILVVD